LFPKHDIIKAYGGGEVKLLTFLNWALHRTVSRSKHMTVERTYPLDTKLDELQSPS
jgi:hypothetical protein